jgi:Tfp pilus assembly protein PilF
MGRLNRRTTLLLTALLLVAGIAIWVVSGPLSEPTRIETALRSAREAEAAGRPDLVHEIFRKTMKRAGREDALLRGYAAFLERIGDPNALRLRKERVANRPGEPEPILDWVLCALRFGMLDGARDGLDRLPKSAWNSARPHHHLASILFREGRFDEAAQSYRRASEIEPGNRFHTLNRFAAELRGKNPETAKAAAEAMRDLARDPVVGKPALAHLVSYLLMSKQAGPDLDAAAERLGNELVPEDPNYPIYLRYLRACHPDRFRERIERALDSPDERATVLIPWLRWLWGLGDRALVDEMMRRAEKTVDARSDFALFEAEIAKALDQPDRLRRCLAKRAWETMRAARATYAFWLARDEPTARVAASRLMREATAADPAARFFVAATLESWGLREEAVHAWILLAGSEHPMRDVARARVIALAVGEGHSAWMLQLFSALAAREPADLDLRTKSLYLKLLVEGASRDAANEAGQLAAAAPDSDTVAAIRAYAHFALHETDAALAILSETDLERFRGKPESLMAGIILETIDPPKALAVAETGADKLRLPEERELLRMLRERCRGGATPGD